jgi:hypothetical protein
MIKTCLRLISQLSLTAKARTGSANTHAAWDLAQIYTWNMVFSMNSFHIPKAKIEHDQTKSAACNIPFAPSNF